ncbi:DUF1592 domain-containing protein [Armatimonas rosea]|uniref:DUF1592 domain-containing protein n=1 Tax=Armatimonas rosea TaxID=685828 RepID=A0A7W9SR94_ARMRO|nr:DUF1592 domain-containing protein [Armatimonas rosea]MBB6050534.1 hypothetical protein [Armatimonas rosea]
MLRRASLFAIGLPLAALTAAAALPQKKAAPKKPAAAPTAQKAATVSAGAFERDVLPLVQKYCVGCHTGPNGSGGINLSGEKNFAAVLKGRVSWDRVSAAVLEKRMPPSGSPAPTDPERKKLGNTLESLFSQADCQLNDPGRVTMRRLNRAEYNNTLRDLLGVDLHLADSFPNDDVGYGFDNIGDVLSLSPLLMEKYLGAAEKAARAAIVAPEDKLRAVKFTAAQLKGPGSVTGEGYLLSSNGEAGTEFDFPAPGEYTIVVRAGATAAGPDIDLPNKKRGPDPAKMAINVGGKPVRIVAVITGPSNPQDYRTTVAIEQPGKQKLGAAFLNDFYDEKLPPERRDRNLYVESVAVQIPDDVQKMMIKRELPFSHRKIVTDTPENATDAEWDRAAKAVLVPLAHRAFRRPVTDPEVQRLIGLSRLAKNQKQSFERGIQIALQGILVSPSFLFRPEPDAKPDDPTARRQLTDHELATRLSYFLWSSMPDDELLGLADQKKLQNPAVLLAQAKRLLKDPRSRALADNFAGQWLQLRKVGVVQPDTARFPAFTEPLRQAMRTEAELFFTGVVQEDRSILEFLDSDYTYLNETLAKHYGNPTVKGDEFRRVPLLSGQRGGVLSMASVLTLTSNPGRTSPVKRGKWVLENLLGTPPPPPPPNVPALDAPGKPIEAENLRKRLEIHRANPACANCHTQMDAIGLAMENYDAVGKWRTDDGGKPIDVSGTLPDGSKFDGPKDLKKVLLAKKGQFTKAMTERLLTYALGRGVERTDKCNLEVMAKSVEAKGYKFSSMVEAVITSQPFRERRGDESGKK